MKLWVNHEDFVLSRLSKMIINRDLLKIKIKKHPIDDESFYKNLRQYVHKIIYLRRCFYFVFRGSISNQIYQLKKQKSIYYTKMVKLKI